MQSSSDSAGIRFVQNYLGFVVMGVFFLLALVFLLSSDSPGDIFSPDYLFEFLNGFLMMGIIAIGTVAATRIKGPDLSVPTVMALAGVMIAADPSIVGISLAVLLCLFFGLINGTVISLLNAPSAVVTFITSLLIAGVAYNIAISSSDYGWVRFERMDVAPEILSVIALVVSAGVAFGALAVTKRLMNQKDERKQGVLPKLMDVLGYGLVAIIAVIAGFALINWNGGASSWDGYQYQVYVIIVFAAVKSSRLLKSSMVALAYGFAAALVLSVYWHAVYIARFIIDLSYWNEVIFAAIALLLFCTACAAQGGWRSMLTPNLSECTETNPE